MFSLDIVSDVSAIVTYGITLYVSDLSWVITGLSVAMRILFLKIDTVTIMICILQLSDTCDTTRVLLRGPSVYVVGFFAFVLSLLSRQNMFTQRTEPEKRAFVCLLMTIALSTRGAVQHRILFNMVKASIYVVLCRVSDNKLGVWDVQARSCWIFSAYWYYMLIAALMQVSFDAEKYEITFQRKPKTSKNIETWDVSI